MATILVVADTPDVVDGLLPILSERGHNVLSCGGGATFHGACPLLRHDSCDLAAVADVIVFARAFSLPARGRTYRAEHILRAYRSHPTFARVPMLIVSAGEPPRLSGSGVIAYAHLNSPPLALADAIEALLQYGRGVICLPPDRPASRQVLAAQVRADS